MPHGRAARPRRLSDERLIRSACVPFSPRTVFTSAERATSRAWEAPRRGRALPTLPPSPGVAAGVGEPDAVLVAGARRPEAFAALYERYFEAISALALSAGRCGGGGDAAHQVFVQRAGGVAAVPGVREVPLLALRDRPQRHRRRVSALGDRGALERRSTSGRSGGDARTSRVSPSLERRAPDGGPDAAAGRPAAGD